MFHTYHESERGVAVLPGSMQDLLVLIIMRRYLLKPMIIF